MTEEKIKAKVQMGILKPVGEIFEAIVDPEIMNKYFISTSTGRMESGKTLTWTCEDFEGEHEVKIGKIEKYKVVSFEWNGSGVNCIVVITAGTEFLVWRKKSAPLPATSARKRTSRSCSGSLPGC